MQERFKQQQDKVKTQAMAAEGEILIPSNVNKGKPESKSTLWHKRMGHTPLARLKRIKGLKEQLEGQVEVDVCLTCPMAKLAKLPFQYSTARAERPFEPIHIDLWGP